MAARSGHFMPASLLASQFSVLEPLATDEPGVRVAADAHPDIVVTQALAALDLPNP
jgi:gluconokinase